MSSDLILTGILGKTDAFQRLHLCLVDVLSSHEKTGGRDSSWARLKAAIPYSNRYTLPYALPFGGAADDSGIRGECWVTILGSQDRRRRILTLAEELRGKEVTLTVRPRRYSFSGKMGTKLQLVTIEAL